MGRPMVRCERCRGTGLRRLGCVDDSVLAMVGTDWGATGDIADPALGMRRNVLLYRLHRLESLGLIESRPLAESDEPIIRGHGREKQWRRTP